MIRCLITILIFSLSLWATDEKPYREDKDVKRGHNGTVKWQKTLLADHEYELRLKCET